MLMRSLVNLIERDINETQKRFGNVSLDGDVKYLVKEEARQSLRDINQILKRTRAQIELNPKLEVTEKSAKPFRDFLVQRWLSVKSGPASYAVYPSSATNLWCSKLADWLSEPLDCSALLLLMPTLKMDAQSCPRDLGRYVLNDANDDLIDVYACLKNAYEDDYNTQLKHTSFTDKVAPPLSKGETYRVIHCCNEALAVYNLIAAEKKSPIKIGCALRELQSAMRYVRKPFLLAYQVEGSKRLLANLFQTTEQLVEAMAQYPKEEWPCFIRNFDLHALSQIILQVEPGDSRFKEKIQAILQHNKDYYDNDTLYDAHLFLLNTLFSGWLQLKQDEFDRCLEEMDVSIISEILLKKEEEQDKLLVDSSADGALLSDDSIVYTPLACDFYVELQEKIGRREALICIIKEYITSEADLIDALLLMTKKSDVFNKFLTIFNYEELSRIWLKKIPVDTSEFLLLLNDKIMDDSICRDDMEYNSKLSYALHYYYSIWRLLQDDHMTKVPFIGWKLGCPKNDKLEACRFNQSFLMSRKSVDEYNQYMESYVEKITTQGDKKGESAKDKSVVLASLQNALRNGTMLIMTDRMKQIIHPDFNPTVQTKSPSLCSEGV